mmetsp:Transcript_105199/g.302526  ORF Transcript_105199/g.302526 Transcript_105199/m.302526 type:complete len:100 (+) Transcript_105199:1230-1529(+)
MFKTVLPNNFLYPDILCILDVLKIHSSTGKALKIIIFIVVVSIGNVIATGTHGFIVTVTITVTVFTSLLVLALVSMFSDNLEFFTILVKSNLTVLWQSN